MRGTVLRTFRTEASGRFALAAKRTEKGGKAAVGALAAATGFVARGSGDLVFRPAFRRDSANAAPVLAEQEKALGRKAHAKNGA